MSVTGWAAALARGLVCFALTGAVAGQVTLRGGEGELDGEVAELTAAGVVVRSQGAGGRPALRLVGWDRVREVGGEAAAGWEAWRPVADEAWRARTRLERGDWAGAEPIFEALFERYRGVGGPTAAVVQEGTLRCRLHRGAQVGAVWAWLEWVRTVHGAAGAREGWVGGRFDAPPVIDAERFLAPTVPPIWLSEPGIDAAASAEDWSGFGSGDAAAAELAGLYRAAARFEAGLEPEIPPAVAPGPGVTLVREIVLARAGTPEERTAGRAALTARCAGPDLERWVEAWCRAGLGRSLLREEDAQKRVQGVVQLMHVPARFGRVTPALAGVCLAEAAAALHGLGDEAGARRLKAELEASYPDHPALRWRGVREIQGTPADDAKAAEQAAPGAGPTDAGAADPGPPG